MVERGKGELVLIYQTRDIFRPYTIGSMLHIISRGAPHACFVSYTQVPKERVRGEMPSSYRSLGKLRSTRPI